MPHIAPARARPCAHPLHCHLQANGNLNRDSRPSTGTGALAHFPRELPFFTNPVSVPTPPAPFTNPDRSAEQGLATRNHPSKSETSSASTLRASAPTPVIHNARRRHYAVRPTCPLQPCMLR
jgi:hypothetical protein